MKLYEIAEAYRQVDAEIEANGGELTPELEAELSALGDSLEAKVDAFGGLIREALAEAEAYKTEKDRLSARQQAAAARAARWKDFLLRTLKVIGRDRVKGVAFSARVAQSSAPSIRWEGEAYTIPEAFLKVTASLDGKAAQDAFRAGTLPEGFTVDRSEYLDLR